MLSEIALGSESGALPIPNENDSGCANPGTVDSTGHTPQKCVGYKLESEQVAAGASSTSRSLKIWIDEALVTDEITNQKLSLKLYIVSEVGS